MLSEKWNISNATHSFSNPSPRRKKKNNKKSGGVVTRGKVFETTPCKKSEKIGTQKKKKIEIIYKAYYYYDVLQKLITIIPVNAHATYIIMIIIYFYCYIYTFFVNQCRLAQFFIH